MVLVSGQCVNTEFVWEFKRGLVEAVRGNRDFNECRAFEVKNIIISINF